MLISVLHLYYFCTAVLVYIGLKKDSGSLSLLQRLVACTFKIPDGPRWYSLGHENTESIHWLLCEQTLMWQGIFLIDAAPSLGGRSSIAPVRVCVCVGGWSCHEPGKTKSESWLVFKSTNLKVSVLRCSQFICTKSQIKPILNNSEYIPLQEFPPLFCQWGVASLMWLENFN